ncbi:MAG: hypothetical protein ABIH23_16335 [bacterium]
MQRGSEGIMEKQDVSNGELTDNSSSLPGIWRELGDLPSGAVVSEEGLAKIFDRHPTSIKRAIERGELPHPTKLLGMPVWTVEKILIHLAGRQDEAEKDAQRTQRKVQELRA